MVGDIKESIIVRFHYNLEHGNIREASEDFHVLYYVLHAISKKEISVLNDEYSKAWLNSIDDEED